MGHGGSEQRGEDTRTRGGVIAHRGRFVMSHLLVGEQPSHVVKERRSNEFGRGTVVDGESRTLQSVCPTGDVVAVRAMATRRVEREEFINIGGGGEAHVIDDRSSG